LRTMMRIPQRQSQRMQHREGLRRRVEHPGLSITREIVEAHGGRVWAESTPGEGSAFSMGFPLR
jgi:signal transduction histidine kinase